MKRIFVTGGGGMLGSTLQQYLCNYDFCIGDLPEFDITDVRKVNEAFKSFQPDVVIHCAAMTDVDGCECKREAAYKINAFGSAVVASATQRIGARLIAISTDYVFDGALDRPYNEFDNASPATVYGASKLAGEESIRAHCPDHTIIRTAWLYGGKGPSFLHTMLRLGAEEGAPLKIVDDQIGNPTSTDVLSELIVNLIENPVPGIVHGSCEGEATWFEFAQEIFRLYGLKRMLQPCTSAEFPRPAPRPMNSRMEKCVIKMSGLASMPIWQYALEKFMMTQSV